MNPDSDSIYRRAALFEVFDGNVLPSLALASFLTDQENTPLKIYPGRFMLGNREISVDAAGKAILNFRGPSGTHKAYSAASVIQSELRLQNGEAPAIKNLEDFKDAYVFFGFSAPGLFDLRPVPVSGVYPGVEIYLAFNKADDEFPVWRFPPRCSTTCWPMISSGLFPQLG